MKNPFGRTQITVSNHHRGGAAFLLAVLTSAALAEDAAPPAMIVMKQDMVVADGGHAALPALRGHQALPCARATDRGYMVVCRDAEGHQRMACLPFSDPWGHASARAWLYDPSLQPNTIVVQIPLELGPGSFLLARGEQYPLLAADEAAYTVRYTFGDFCRTVVVSKANADLKPPPVVEKDPAKIREHSLDRALAQRRHETERLGKDLQSIEESNQKIQGFLKQLNETDLEIFRLRAGLARAQTIRQTLMDYQPETGDLRRAKADQWEKTTLDEGRLSARRMVSGLDADTMRELQARAQNAELELARAKTQAMKSRSELDAVIAFASGKTMDREKKALGEKLDAAAQEHAVKSGEHLTGQSSLDLVQALRMEIDKITAENKKLTESIDKMTKEIEKLLKDPPPGR